MRPPISSLGAPQDCRPAAGPARASARARTPLHLAPLRAPSAALPGAGKADGGRGAGGAGRRGGSQGWVRWRAPGNAMGDTKRTPLPAGLSRGSGVRARAPSTAAPSPPRGVRSLSLPSGGPAPSRGGLAAGERPGGSRTPRLAGEEGPAETGPRGGVRTAARWSSGVRGERGDVCVDLVLHLRQLRFQLVAPGREARAQRLALPHLPARPPPCHGANRSGFRGRGSLPDSECIPHPASWPQRRPCGP